MAMEASPASVTSLDIACCRVSCTVEAAPLTRRPIRFFRCVVQQHLLSNDQFCSISRPWGKAISLRFPDYRIHQFRFRVGTLIGLFTAGPASDYIGAVLTRRNKGIGEPEMSLVTMIPLCVDHGSRQLCRSI